MGPSWRGPHRRGAVLIVMVISVTMFVGLIFFVFNLGDQINQRITMQSAADSSAISAATWIARSNNIIAMTHVAQAKLVSLVPVYDSIPLAAEVARADLDSSEGMLDTLREQIARGIAEDRYAQVCEYRYVGRGNRRRRTGSGARFAFLAEGLQRLLTELTPRTGAEGRNDTERSHYDRLVLMDDALNADDEQSIEPGGYDVGKVTRWSSGDDKGELWQVALSLRELSEATANSAATLAQQTAKEFGQMNNARSAFVLPLDPKPPYRVGEFSDFMPVLLGKMRVRDTADATQVSYPIEGIVRNINNWDRQIIRKNEQAAEIQVRIDALNERQPDQVRDPEEYAEWESELNRELERIASVLNQVRNLNNRKENEFVRMHHKCPGGVVPQTEFPYRLGPYAKLYKWRFSDYAWGGGWSRTIGGGGSDPEFGQDRIRVSVPNSRYLVGYTVYGPYRWAMQHVEWRFGRPGHHRGLVGASKFTHYHAWASNAKMAMLHGLEHPQKIRYPTRWISDYEEAREFARDPKNAHLVLRTRWYRVRVASKYKWTDSKWLEDPGTYYSWDHVYLPWQGAPTRWIQEHNGWWDVQENYLSQPRQQARGEQAYLGNYIWRWMREDEVRFDRRCGILEMKHEDGRNVMQKRYLASWYVFGGLQTAQEGVTADPMDWPSSEDYLPAPILMDISEGDYEPIHNQGWRGERFNLLSFCERDDTSKVWPEQFVGGNPADRIVATAQAQIFNPMSWDYWTQDWRVQLAPVTEVPRWKNQMTQDLETASEDGDVDLDVDSVRDVNKYIEAIPDELWELFGQD